MPEPIAANRGYMSKEDEDKACRLHIHVDATLADDEDPDFETKPATKSKKAERDRDGYSRLQDYCRMLPDVVIKVRMIRQRR